MRWARRCLLWLPAVMVIVSAAPAAAPDPGQGAGPTAMDRVSAALISRTDALRIANAAIASCERQGETAAAFVTDSDGYLRAALSSDGLNPIGLSTATLKTATVLQFKVSTRTLQERLTSDPAFASEYGNDARYFYHPGGVPIFRAGKFVAVLAVGGGHDKDESCALEALRLLSWATIAP